MLRVVIESPYSGEVERNLAYARKCLRHSLDRFEAPFASHLIYPQVYDDTNPKERERALQACHEWIAVADVVAFYTDFNWSRGMLRALKIARLLSKPRIETRSLNTIYPIEFIGYEEQNKLLESVSKRLARD